MKSERITILESQKIEFEKAADGIREYGEQLMRENYDKGGKDPKEFHTSEHPRVLQKRAKELADIFGLSPSRRKIVEDEISCHDIVIQYDLPDPKDVADMIKRHRGARAGDKPNGDRGNEALSAGKMLAEMQRINQEAGKMIFSDEQMATAVWGIDATYPDVDLGKDFQGASFKEYPLYKEIVAQNPKARHILNIIETHGITKGANFFQPHLEKPLEEGKKVPEEVVIMALVDLGGAGMADDREFFKEGNAEFRELSANVSKPENLKRLAESDQENDKRDRAKVSEAMQKWLNGQTSFAAWQMLRFEKNIFLLKKNGQLDKEQEKNIRNKFGNFESNIKATLERAETVDREYRFIKQVRGEKEAFLYIAREMGYKV